MFRKKGYGLLDMTKFPKLTRVVWVYSKTIIVWLIKPTTLASLQDFMSYPVEPSEILVRKPQDKVDTKFFLEFLDQAILSFI